MMQPKRTMTMNWDGLGEDDDDFFDSNNRISAVVPIDLIDGISSGSSDDEFDDPRLSFVDPRMSFADPRMSFADPRISFSDPRMSISDGAPRLSNVGGAIPAGAVAAAAMENYDLWMAAPTSINERRRKLLQGMGLNSSKELLRMRTLAMSTKYGNVSMKPRRSSVAPPLPPSCQSKTTSSSSSSPPKKDEKKGDNEAHENKDEDQQPDSPSQDIDPFLLVRSRSDGDMHPFSVDTKRRKEELIGKVSKQRLTRTLSTIAPFARLCQFNYTVDTKDDSSNKGDCNKRQKRSKDRRTRKASASHTNSTSGQLGAFFLIKNLDTGKEFIVKEFAEDGMWNRLSDVQTGKQLTMEEFEKSVGHSRLVKELMRREKVRRGDGSHGLERKTSVNAILSKSFRYSKRKSQSLIKNMSKKVAHSVTGSGSNSDSEKENQPTSMEQPPQKGGKSSGGSNSNTNSNSNSNSNANNEWVKVRAQGKNQKELTALRFCQGIQAHQGSIWTLKFNFDGRYLASAGEDKVIHVWEVQECEIASLGPPQEGGSAPVQPMLCPSPDRGDRPPLAPDLSMLEKKKKGKSASRRGSIMPDYVQLPETVFALSNDPICSFEGHLDDVLDLSWSASELLLLSSSMDKTVRLWDLEKKACLKLFAHNDYVTCIQFNPVSDDHFISGSLDAKVRIWSVSGRRVVDWTDLHEMVTATCYTPDGQGAAIGTHKGNCRLYNITDGKLSQTSQFDIPTKKKTTPKKITGFEFNADKPSEVLVTSADSRVRIYDGIDIIQKFRGFRNTNSQIAASFSPDGKYVISASEDSNVYLWKRQEQRNGKTKMTIETNSHEHFQCKDVSVAIPWPGGRKSSSTQLNNKNNKPPTTMGSPMRDDGNKNKKQLPPLPNNKKAGNATEKADSNDYTDNENNGDGELDSDPSKLSWSASVGGSTRGGDSPSRSSNQSASPSRSPSRSVAGGGGGADTTQATAWGLVIVTAGLGGEIRTYQNFGLPVKVGSNLF